MPSRRQLLAATPLAAALLVAACSTGPSGATPSAATGAPTAEAGAFPVTIRHAHGSTTLTKAPTRIATVGWADADTVVALGLTPVGAPKITWGGNAKGSTDWFDAAAGELGIPEGAVTRYDDSAGIPLDAIAATRPDLILGLSSGISAEDYTKLSRIAPVVPYLDKAWGTPWRDQVSTIGKAVGRPAAAERLRAETEQVLAEGAAAHPAIKGRTAAWTWFTPTDLSTIGIYASSDLRPQMLRELGFAESPTVTALSRANPTAFSVNLSAEKASTLEADVIVFYAEEGASAEQLRRNALIGRIPALRDGHYVASADNAVALSMSLPSPLSVRTAVRDFLPKLASAAAGTPAS